MKRKKTPVLPSNAAIVPLPLTREARERLDAAVAQLSGVCGQPVAPTTLLEVLFSESQIRTALASLEPRFLKLAELEKQRRDLGIYFE